MAFSNPFAFSRASVTIIATAVYAALIAFLIVLQVELPASPSSPTPIHGVNLTEAWQDLQLLTAQYHPYNSRRNDFVHDWLVNRIQSIVGANNGSSTPVYVFDDQVSNLTSSTSSVSKQTGGISVYFEGTNIITYIRGKEDDKTEWWKKEDGKPAERRGVMVNAHYDSVSTGFGSTDDGVGVISVLQLIRYYTTKGNQPQNGLVLLLNNGEEDFLNGARAFGQHPMSRFVNAFLNLEGAGAGGRAALFRSTDEEVTRAYAKSPYPFGTVISGDAFNKGLVRSQTDYVIFNGVFGYRGLDVAFIGPRSRYHTNQDDSRHTGQKALWHMLSSAVATTKELTGGKGITPSSDSHRSIWFDVAGRAFVLMQSHTFFALSVALLVVGPIILLLTLIALHSADKLYLFAGSRHVHTADGDSAVQLHGWRGLFRFPFIALVASAAPVALAYLLFKENEEIVHSSPWPVWAMMISAFIFVAWFLSRFADYIRPSALTRAYGFGWICFGWWVFLVVALVYEEQFHLAGGYFTLFFSASAFFTTWLSYLELFSLPKKKKFCHEKIYGEEAVQRSRASSRPASSRRDNTEDVDGEEEETTEQSSLLRSRGRSAYKTAYNTQSPEDPDENTSTKIKKGLMAKHDEQEWSSPMWDWLWILQFIVIVPINVVILGQLGFYLVDALHQTGQDGSSAFIVYIGIAIVTIFIFSPILPVVHRLTWQVPVFFLLVLIGTLVYNLLAFPFSPQNRLKLYFQQQVDLDNGNNSVSFLGLPPYVQATISHIPSAAGQDLDCVTVENRVRCSWSGPEPKVAPTFRSLYNKSPYKAWVNYNVSIVGSSKSEKTARFSIVGKNTRACKLSFDSPVSGIHVLGQSPEDKRLPSVPEQGSTEVRLWSRTWDRSWTVDVTWNTEEHGEGLTGKAICLWSDINQNGVIPAFDEAEHYVPVWVAVTKAADGLVEGYKRFKISG
ncbi:hypothetical protein H2198_003886 [Neophaeococcomyces mojaviensis]|uniref:Uncharacterized protein n=1 Tax=Neophaeococcomyces mojaviensis TaxID=3383035 RepID=A0ACC3AA68_9EURO|nr:hypothetical protein H2198_003886 [Knufia sp. JES_112]